MRSRQIHRAMSRLGSSPGAQGENPQVRLESRLWKTTKEKPSGLLTSLHILYLTYRWLVENGGVAGVGWLFIVWINPPFPTKHPSVKNVRKKHAPSSQLWVRILSDRMSSHSSLWAMFEDMFGPEGNIYQLLCILHPIIFSCYTPVYIHVYIYIYIQYILNTLAYVYYVCMYAYMYIYIFTCIQLYICIYIYMIYVIICV